MTKELTAKEIQSRGGKANLRKYGREKFVEMGKKAQERIRAADPNHGKRLSILGRIGRYRKMDREGTIDKETLAAKLADLQTKLDNLS